MKHFNVITIAAFVVFLFTTSCDKKDSLEELDGIENPPELFSETPHIYDENKNEYIVSITKDGGEYFFDCPKNTIKLGTIYINSQIFYNEKEVFSNENLKVSVINDKITVNITPNTSENKIQYTIIIDGLNSFTKIVFNQD